MWWRRRARTEVLLQPGPLDYPLLVALIALVALGLMAVYSASLYVGVSEERDGAYFLKRQALWTLLGVGFFGLFLWAPYRWWRPLSPLLLLLSLLLLMAVLQPGWGVEKYGATRWLRLGPLPDVQPSEFAKLGLILYVAAWLGSRGERIKDWLSGFLPFVLLVGPAGGLILLEPDMGTAVIFALVTGTLFFLAGASIRHLLLLLFVGVVAGVLLIFGAEYRASRWEAFIDPFSHPRGVGFQVIQALIALGSGGPFGLGIGTGRQKFGYMPNAHTDGIFAIIGEEAGFVGSLAVLLLYGFVVYRCFRLLPQLEDRFAALLVAGVALWIALQALINIGGATHVLPLTGIPLPFLSYGGSALAANLAAMGLVLNVSRYRRRATISPNGKLVAG